MMQYTYNQITSEEYYKSDDEKISFVSELELKSKFAYIETLHKKYLLSWHCKTCTLLIREPLDGIFILAIDLKVLIIDFNKNNYKEIDLDFFFSDLIKYSDKIYLICTELEILVFNIFTKDIENRIQLTDMYESSLAHKDYIEIQMMDKNVLRYKKKENLTNLEALNKHRKKKKMPQ